MRAVILAFVIIYISASLAEKGGDFMKVSKDCIKELGVKTNDKGRPDREDAEKKCLAKCIGLKMGAFDDKGTLIESKIPEKMRATAKECDAKSKNDDLCKRASALQKCMFSKMKKNKE